MTLIFICVFFKNYLIIEFVSLYTTYNYLFRGIEFDCATD